MVHNDIDFHNTVEMEPAAGGGLFLRRFPREVRNSLSSLGRMVSQESAGVELRFVTDAHSFRLSLGCLRSVLAPWEIHDQDVVIFRGAFFHSHRRITPGCVNHLDIVNIAGANPFDSITPDSAYGRGFAPQVWRILLGRYPAIFYGLDTYGYAVRPPVASEVPSRRWIAYGSSITNGASPTVHSNSYIYHAARTAHLDVLNQGLSGSCLCEPEIAGYFSSRDDWDIITLEIGVNMRSSFSPAQFRERAKHLVERLSAAHPSKQVVLISVYPNSASRAYTRTLGAINTLSQDAFSEILLELTHSRPSVSIIKGDELLDDLSGLTVDLIHPSDYGHAQLGMSVGERLRSLSPVAEPGAVAAAQGWSPSSE